MREGSDKPMLTQSSPGTIRMRARSPDSKSGEVFPEPSSGMPHIHQPCDCFDALCFGVFSMIFRAIIYSEQGYRHPTGI